MESQSWWEQTAGKSGTEYGHVDVGTCFPFGQTLTGASFDVRVVLYDEPGTLSTVELQLFGSKLEDDCKSQQCQLQVPGQRALYLVVSSHRQYCAHPADGRQEFRFHAIVNQPDGNRRCLPLDGKPI